MKNTIPSATRTTAIGKYLVALSASFVTSGKGEDQVSLGRSRKASGRRKQLHILYLLNDLLHHTKYHTESSATYSTLTGNIQPHLVDLLGYASAYDPVKFARHHNKLGEILDIWVQHGYYQSSYIEKLRETVINAAGLGYTGGDDGLRQQNGTSENTGGGSKKDLPYIMPASHGDNSTPYYDLPAGNMMPHIVPNSSVPINPKLVKPLQFVAGPADEGLAVAMAGFLKEVASLYGTGSDPQVDVVGDMDELGQPAIRDEISGDLIEGEGYYGWSRAFCERMRRRRDVKGPLVKSSRPGRSADRSASPLKRRRYSYSESSRSRSRSPLRARTRSREGRRTGLKRSYSSSRSPSRGQRGLQARNRDGPESRRRNTSGRRSRSPSYSPDRHQPIIAAHSQASAISQTQAPSSTPHPFSTPFSGLPLGPNGLPIPPPPPPNYKGPWPPPPPPLPVPGGSYPPFSALVPPPPPPPNGRGSYQASYGANAQAQHAPMTVGWPQQQGNNAGRGSYATRGGPQSGRGQRSGWHA